MEFSDPYCDAYQYIVVKEDDDKVKTIDDLAGYIIGVHLGTTGDFLASDEVNMGVLAGTGASVQQYKDLTIAAMGLKAGDVQAIVCDKLLAENLCTINVWPEVLRSDLCGWQFYTGAVCSSCGKGPDEPDREGQ